MLLSRTTTLLAGVLCLTVCVGAARGEEPLSPLPGAPVYQLSRLRTEQDQLGRQIMAADFQRTQKGPGRVVIRGKSANGTLSIAASISTSTDSGTIRLQNLFSSTRNVPQDIELYLAQPVRINAQGGTQYAMVSNPVRLGNPGAVTRPRPWTTAEKEGHAAYERMMNDDTAHKPIKVYQVTVEPTQGSEFVPNTAKVTKGTRLHACYQNKWYPITALSENEDGTLNVRWDDWGAEFDCSMSRGELIITQDLLNQLGNHPSTKFPKTVPNIVDPSKMAKPIPATAKPRKSYAVSIAIPTDSLIVPDNLKIKEGVALQACYAGKWNPITALRENEDGSLNVRWDEYGASFDCSMIRAELIIKKSLASQLEANPNFTPEIRPLKRKSYPVTIPVPSGSLLVPPGAKIVEGIKLQACWAGKWNPITAISEANDGSLNVRWDAFGPSYDCSMLRQELIIDRATLNKLQQEASATPAMRTWTDSTGSFKVQAKLVSKTDTSVTLLTDAGRQVTLPISKLSDTDRQFLGGNDKPTNPFAP